MWALDHCRGAELLLEAPKSPNNVTSTFFNTVNLPSKELRFDRRGAKLRPWGRRICFLPRAPSDLVTPLNSTSFCLLYLQVRNNQNRSEKCQKFEKCKLRSDDDIVFLEVMTDFFPLKPFNDRSSQHIGAPFFGHKSPATRARELFKPSTDSASLGVKIEKKFFSFWV